MYGHHDQQQDHIETEPGNIFLYYDIRYGFFYDVWYVICYVICYDIWHANCYDICYEILL